MNEQEIRNALPAMFRQAKARQGAKEELYERLFGAAELSDDDLCFVSAAGNPDGQEQNQLRNRGNII